MKETQPNERWKELVLELQKAAREKSITDQYIADQIDVKRQSINRLWTLKFAPSIKLVNAIGEVLNLELNWKEK